MTRDDITSVMKAALSRQALLAAMPVVVALLLSGVISFSYNRMLKDYRDAVDHTFQTLSGIDSALLRLQDAETGQRGFIITGDDAYLAPFKAGQRDLDAALARLMMLLADNGAQQARIAQMRQLADAKIAELSDTIAIRKSVGFDAARLQVMSNSGKQTMDSIRALADAMRVAEDELLATRLANARFAERMMILVAVICVALSLLGRFAAFVVTTRLKHRKSET